MCCLFVYMLGAKPCQAMPRPPGGSPGGWRPVLVVKGIEKWASSILRI
jgi:hypothetical protein